MKKQNTLLYISIGIVMLLIIFQITSCSSGKPRLDVEKELISTDSLFSVVSAEQGMKKAFLAYLDTSAVLIRKNRMPIEGESLIKNFFEGFSDTSFILTWKPLKARLSADNTMGFTYGVYEIAEKTTGNLSGTGTYVTIWQKNGKGNWKAIFDAGNEGTGK